MSSKATVYVDLPNPFALGPECVWTNVGRFDDLSAAVEWIRTNIDPRCDNEGNINLLTHGEVETDTSTREPAMLYVLFRVDGGDEGGGRRQVMASSDYEAVKGRAVDLLREILIERLLPDLVGIINKADFETLQEMHAVEDRESEYGIAGVEIETIEGAQMVRHESITA